MNKNMQKQRFVGPAWRLICLTLVLYLGYILGVHVWLFGWKEVLLWAHTPNAHQSFPSLHQVAQATLLGALIRVLGQPRVGLSDTITYHVASKSTTQTKPTTQEKCDFSMPFPMVSTVSTFVFLHFCLFPMQPLRAAWCNPLPPQRSRRGRGSEVLCGVTDPTSSVQLWHVARPGG